MQKFFANCDKCIWRSRTKILTCWQLFFLPAVSKISGASCGRPAKKKAVNWSTGDHSTLCRLTPPSKCHPDIFWEGVKIWLSAPLEKEACHLEGGKSKFAKSFGGHFEGGGVNFQWGSPCNPFLFFFRGAPIFRSNVLQSSRRFCDCPSQMQGGSEDLRDFCEPTPLLDSSTPQQHLSKERPPGNISKALFSLCYCWIWHSCQKHCPHPRAVERRDGKISMVVHFF